MQSEAVTDSPQWETSAFWVSCCVLPVSNVQCQRVNNLASKIVV